MPLKTFANGVRRSRRLACLSCLCVVHLTLSGPAFADEPKTSPVVIKESTSNKEKPPMADQQAIKLTVEMAKGAFKAEEPLALTLTFSNISNGAASIMLPMGNDVHGLFTYEIVETGSEKNWLAQQCSPQSFANDERRVLAAGATCHHTESQLSFRSQGVPFTNFLPPGHYRLAATYDGQRTFDPKNKIPLFLKSNTVKFSINPK